MLEKFNPAAWARIRGFNQGQGLHMKAEPVARLQTGEWICSCEPDESRINGASVWQIGFEWDQPRDIRGVIVTFADSFDCATVQEQYVQYWQRTWPGQHPDRRPGAHRGWIPVDDAYNGKWVEAFGEIHWAENGSSMLFDHVDMTELDYANPTGDHKEFNSSEDYNAMYRRTMKLRVLFISPEPPLIKHVTLIGDADVQEKSCCIYTSVTERADAACIRPDDISVYNGILLDVQTITGGFQVRYTANVGANNIGDHTILQFAGCLPFAVDDVNIAQGVYMEDYDLLITAPLHDITPLEKVQSLKKGKESIFDRVPAHPEQTRENAFEQIPEMELHKQRSYGRYVILGWNEVRQKFCLRYNGDIFADKKQQKASRRDVAGTKWAAGMLHFRIASGDPPTRLEGKGECRQYMPDPQIPVYVTVWTDREIEYEQTTFATLRDQANIQKAQLSGDEDVLIMNRLCVRNASEDTHTAKFYLELYPGEYLQLRGNHLVATGRVSPDNTVASGWTVQSYPSDYMRLTAKYEKGALRCIPKVRDGVVGKWMNTGYRDIMGMYDGRAPELELPSTVPTTLLYEVPLGAFETAVIDFVIPYNTPTTAEEMDYLAQFDFDHQRQLITDYWNGFYSSFGRISVADDAYINGFIKAVPWHIAMTVKRDPVTGNFVVPAASYRYTACGNEACMQIRLLDYLGRHDLAEKYLETFVRSQGAKGLDGNFQSNEGALVALSYLSRRVHEEQFAYNLDHGYILSCFADHYQLTGDKKWLQRVAKTLVSGCDFVFRECQAQKQYDDGGKKKPYYGLMPHGHLEDNKEWRCWFAVNAHTCGGVLQVAKALKEIHHPEAERIFEGAMAYREDIRNAVIAAMGRSPAVPSGNGGYIPHVPTHAELRGRDWGWFRETAYGPLHLATGEVFAPNDPIITWILRDLEDNLFISRNYGRIADKEKNWFSHGGIAVQSNLLFNDLLYLQRNEPERALRALFNNFGQNLYRDLHCFTEHPIPEFGHGVGPFFKTSDEAQFIINLRNHLIREDGNELLLLQGASRQWLKTGKSIVMDGMATNFGAISLKTEVNPGWVCVRLGASWRKLPGKIRIFVRREDGKRPYAVHIGGVLSPAQIVGEEIVLPSTDAVGEIKILCK